MLVVDMRSVPAVRAALRQPLLAAGLDAIGFLGQEVLIVGQLQFAVLDAQLIAPEGEVAANLQ